MLWPAPVSFRAQAFIIAAASLAVACLAAFIVRDVIFATESKLLADSQQLCIAASQELRIQYQERAAYAGDPLKNLPRDAQEISLMGISATVLKAYKGIKGGMFLPETDRIMGYTYPTAASGSESELTEIERIFIRSLAETFERRRSNRHSVGVVRSRSDRGRGGPIRRNDSLDDAPCARPPLSFDGNATLVACSTGVFDSAWCGRHHFDLVYASFRSCRNPARAAPFGR